MKKLSVVFAGVTLLASMGAFGYVSRNDTPSFSVKVPPLRSGFNLDVEGLFLEPSNPDLDHGLIDSNQYVNGNPQAHVLTLKPDNKFSWGVGLGYVFPDSGSDLRLNWRGFDHSDAQKVLGNAYSDTTVAKFELDEFGLNAGQSVQIGNYLQLRPFAGIRFARLDSHFVNNYQGNLLTQVVSRRSSNNFKQDAAKPSYQYQEKLALSSRFNGAGPQLGADAQYDLGRGVGLVGHVATALLVGKVKTHLNSEVVTDFDEFVPSGEPFEAVESLSRGVFDIGSDNLTRVVPTLDAKLGLDYCYAFNSESALTVEAGYKATQYIDALDRLDRNDPRSFVYAANSGSLVLRRTSSVGFSGPYVKLNLKI